ncbi:hypothetical protein ACFLYQ_06020 [Chloroflexota bacterium]
MVLISLRQDDRIEMESAFKQGLSNGGMMADKKEPRLTESVRGAG